MLDRIGNIRNNNTEGKIYVKIIIFIFPEELFGRSMVLLG